MIPQLYSPDTEGLFAMPAVDYFAAPGVSHSMLKAMAPTPAHLPPYLAEPREPSAEMVLGTLTHSRILTPEEPLPRLAVKPADMKFSTREGKAWRAEKEGAGLLIVTEAEHEALWGMTRSVSAHPIAGHLLSEGLTEVSAFARFESGGLSCLRKCRFDLIPAANVLCDVKTSSDASPQAFRRDLYEKGYATQAAYYLDLWNALMPDDPREAFVFFVVERKPPFLVASYIVAAAAIEFARERNRSRLETYMRCAAANAWPGYPETLVPLDLPPYAYKAGPSLEFAE